MKVGTFVLFATLVASCTETGFTGNAKKPKKAKPAPEKPVEQPKPPPIETQEATTEPEVDVVEEPEPQQFDEQPPIVDEPPITQTPPPVQPPVIVPRVLPPVVPPPVVPPPVQPPVVVQQQEPPITRQQVEQRTPPVNLPPVGEDEMGNLYVNVVPFVNMEHGIHATSPGTWALVKDQQSQIIGAGPVKLSAACRGRNVNQDGPYPVLTLNIGLTFVHPQAQSGSGSLTICMIANPEAHPAEFTCKDIPDAKDVSRPAHWIDRPFTYEVSDGNQILINNPAGYGNGTTSQSGLPRGRVTIQTDGEEPLRTVPGREDMVANEFSLLSTSEQITGGLSFAHPIEDVCIAKAAMYSDKASPLVIDLDFSNSIDLISVSESSVDFSLDGKSKVRTGWVQPQDGFLVFDVDANNTISSGREMFGEFSHVAPGSEKTARFANFQHGFEALGQYDDNQDGIIDSQDKVYSQLMVWTDRNSDGRSQPKELKSLNRLGIKAISLAYLSLFDDGFPNQGGNELRLEATVAYKDGRHTRIVDVWFGVNRYAEK